MDFAKLNLADNQVLAREIILQASRHKFPTRREFEIFRNKVVKENHGVIFHNLYLIRAYSDLLKEGKIRESENLKKLIQKRSVRTMSGVAPVTVLTKPFPCPGKCVYCPTDVRMPKSYLPSQPAAQRAFRQRFNPYTQVFVRLLALLHTGHEVSKVELRVIGGTWSSYPHKYQTWFIKQCLMAMNEFYKQTGKGRGDEMAKLVEANEVKSPYGVDKVNTVILKPLKAWKKFSAVVKENETALVRCIGINVETRPDFIDIAEIKRLRALGVTKLEIGVQTTDDAVQDLTRRGHDLQSVRDATKLIKDAGFKLSYHMMPNLPGSSVELDKRMVGELFKSPEYQPDYLKIYPCVVVQKSILFGWYNQGRFRPYDDETLMEVLMAEVRDVPEYCRIDRIARDIPSTDVMAGSKVSNVRQILEENLRKAGTPCRDIRSREIMNEKIQLKNVKLVKREYAASGGKEVFLSFEDLKKDKLVALLRLRFPGKTFLKELKNAAIVREIHVYGKQIAVGKRGKGEKQHLGWGTKLMNEAESLAKVAGYKKMAVIAGIGTREYYKKMGYRLKGSYMLRDI
ncbi:MAG: tRNA uridine(34) 5-carboxymethylaminomethyl modification radical SAM/GNAT enzyme Elp3 [Candidatus Gracilibacteria bacterium]